VLAAFAVNAPDKLPSLREFRGDAPAEPQPEVAPRSCSPRRCAGPPWASAPSPGTEASMADAKMLGRASVEEGLRRIPQLVLEDLGAQLAKEVEDLTEALQRAAPVSALEAHPGQLRDGIVFYPNPGRPLSYMILASARDTKGRLFGRYVEFGHIAADGTHIPASSFWFPTYRARRKAMRRRLSQASLKRIRTLFPET
jgi:hypothetical protein